MAEFDRSRAYGVQTRSPADSFAYDEGLRAYMLRVYNYMGIGLVITGITAYVFYSMATTVYPAQAVEHLHNGVMLTALGKAIYTSWLGIVVALAPLAVLLMFYGRMNQMSPASAQAMFWAFAALMGLSLSSIFVQYTGASITRVFFITAATFGAFSLWGYTTKRDLTAMRSFFMMGVIGLFIAMVVNIFMQSSALQFAISVIAVGVFTGMTAYATQSLKDNYYQFERDGEAAVGRSAVLGAMLLYVLFLNIFIWLLQLFGEERR